MSRFALPCARCDTPLVNVMDDCQNQPEAGTAFESHGHYGSTVFDPMDGSYLELNLCDGCLVELAKREAVYWGLRKHTRIETTLEPWKPELDQPTEAGQDIAAFDEANPSSNEASRSEGSA